MIKTEKLSALKEEMEALKRQFVELTDEKIGQVSGGAGEQRNTRAQLRPELAGDENSRPSGKA